MKKLTLRADDGLVTKLNIIAAYEGLSVNKLLTDLAGELIKKFEAENGEIKLKPKQSGC